VDSQQEHWEVQPVSPFYQVLLIIISFSILSFVYLYQLREFHYADEIERPLPYSPVKLSELGNFHNKILVGFTLERFELFDVTKNNFVFVGAVWFQGDPGAISLDTLEKFEFEQGEVLARSEPDIKIVGDKLLVKFFVRVKFSSPLVYSYFPLDEHRLVISLINKKITPEAALFYSENRYFLVKANIREFGWENLEKLIEYGYKTVHLDVHESIEEHSYNVVNFMIDLKRTSYRYIMSIVMPLLLIFYLSLFSFSMSGATRVSLPAAGLTGIVSFRFVIDSLSPSVGYFMVSDYLFLLFLAATFLSLVLVLFDTFTMQLSMWQKKIIILVLHVVVVLANIYIVIG